ncbi:Interleukin-15 [Heracleum sosnowskyi]|uniref:Interleukin-15 n=1 Tax=Heracleum sosnowskyi TaxID=360622 RepID=A0AAD8HL43_9APIA|nr:Interleukin-15 [Heracleum sosnowskyi]
MAETTDVEGVEGSEQGRLSRVLEEEVTDLETPDVHSVSMKLERAKEVYREYGGIQDKPSKGEVILWCFYGLCSYFLHTVLIPILFPLIISQIFKTPEPWQGWEKSFEGFSCTKKDMEVYQGLTSKLISVSNTNFSALEWTSVSWFIGIILSAPVLGIIGINLDYGTQPQLIAGAVTALGAIFCLPAGFFKTYWIFPPYIAAIVLAATVGTASHTRSLGLMVRGFVGSTIHKSEFTSRQGIASRLSLYATAAGFLGSVIFSTFTYHMLRGPDEFTSLWIVAIFSGLMWLTGVVHIFTANRPSGNSTISPNSVPKTHVVSIFSYPHAAGSLASVFLSSMTTMSIFTGGVLFLVGQLCLEPRTILFIWLTYFAFPLLSLPILHPLQQFIRADAVKMQLLGFLLSTVITGFGLYYRHKNWQSQHVLLFTAVQSTANGVLHAFGRNLLLDCSPPGKEGAFAAWFSWVRALGTCVGFTLATAGAGTIGRPFGVAFCASIFGILVLIFSNISNYEGAVAAGNVSEHSEKEYENPDQTASA